MEMLIIFRNSEKFLYLAQVSAKNDNKKLKKTLLSFQSASLII